MDNFKVNLLKNIEAEVTQLGEKITKIRETQGNSSEYKNLIQAYKEIVDVYYKVKDDIEDTTIIINETTKNLDGTYGKFINTSDIKQNIKRTISVIDTVKDLSEELSRDVKIFTKSDNLFETQKELTPNNHLLFYNGSCQVFKCNYEINNKTIIMYEPSPTKNDVLRIVWLNENSEFEENPQYTLEEIFKFKEIANKELIENFQLVFEDDLGSCKFSSRCLDIKNHILYLNGNPLNICLDYTFFGDIVLFTQDGIEKYFENAINKKEIKKTLIKGIKIKKGDFLKIVWLNNDSEKDLKIKDLEKRLKNLESSMNQEFKE